MSLFDKQYRLLVGQPSGAGRSNEGGVEFNDLRVAFTITKTLSKNPNNSEITIWNMNGAHRELVEKPDTKCEFYAGYREDAGPVLIFQGDVTFAYSNFELPDIPTTIELGDGFKAIRDTMVSLGYGRGVSSHAIITDIANQMGLSVYMANDVPNRLWEFGFSFYGAARKALDRVVAGSNSQWSIQNGILQILKMGSGVTRRAFVLSPDSGMIKTPQRMRKGAEETARVTDQNTNRQVDVKRPTARQEGWKVTSLLLPSINAGDVVKLESRTIQADLVVSKVTHRGDTHDGDWFSEFELVTAKAAQEIRDAEKKRQESAAKAAARRAAKADAATPLSPLSPLPNAAGGAPSLPTPAIPPL